MDCVNSGVCLARGDGGALFNSVEDTSSGPQGVCRLASGARPAIPTFTQWTLQPCASAAPEDFVDFFDDAYACGGSGVPNKIVGFQSCLRTANDDELWNILFTDWCIYIVPESGCYPSVRWRGVEDGEACP